MSSSKQSSLVKHAVIWGAVLWIIHMTMITPLVTVTVWIASIPAVLLYMCTNRKVFALVCAVSLLIGALLSGTFGISFLWFALVMLIPAIAIGEGYRRGWNARKSITAGVIAYLAVFLLSILIVTMAGVNMTQQIGAMVRESMTFFPESMRESLTDDAVHEFIQLMTMMIPFYLMAVSAVLSGLTHTVSWRILRRIGVNAPSLPPVRDWRVPRSFVWFYLIALIADFLVSPGDNSFIAAIVLNLVPLFMVVFAIQGLSFLFFIGYVKRKMWVPWVGIVLVIFISPLFSAFSLLGVFDTAFPIRDRFRKT